MARKFFGGLPASCSLSALRRNWRRCWRSAPGQVAAMSPSAVSSSSRRVRRRSSAVQARGLGGRFAADQRQPGADRLVVGAAHQLAEILQLPLVSAVRRDLLAFAHRFVDVFGQVDALQLADGKLDQFGAEVLQFVHGLLLLGLGRAGAAVGEVFVVHGKNRRHGAAMIAAFTPGRPVHARDS